MTEAVRTLPDGVALLDRPQRGRRDHLAERLYEMLALPRHELERSLRSLLEADDGLPEAERYPAVLERLRALLSLDREDARIVADAMESASDRLPPASRRRRMEAERAVMLNGMGFAEFRRLADLLRWLRDERGLEIFAQAPGGRPADRRGPRPVAA